MADKDKTIMPQPDQFERLARAVEAIAARASITTVVQARPLDQSANAAVTEYGAIARSLRTIFEAVRTTTTTTTTTTTSTTATTIGNASTQ